MIFALAMSGAANCICGPQIRYIRQLFTAIVVPRTDYGAIIWHRPKAHGQLPAGKINRLVGPQRLAIKAIIGSFRIAPTSALQYEMQLPPPDLRLKRKVLQSLTRMHTLPSSHPISPWVEKATWDSRQQQTCHISNLESLARNFPEYTTTLVEKISPFIRPPWWTPRIKVHIEPNKQKAKKHHDNTIAIYSADPNTICIYTDGSDIDGRVGSAAYMNETTKQQHLGKETDHNVFAAELTAIVLGIQIVKEANRTYENCILYVDSQAAINAVTKPLCQSGQHIIQQIHNKVDVLTMNTTLIWIPGHMNISGNEMADDAVKHAAQNDGLCTDPPLPTMKVARNMIIKRRCKEEWKQRWNKGKDAQQLR